MKIALINAGLPDNSCACLRATAYPPLSIVYLATYLKERISSIDIRLIDNQLNDRLSLKKIADCDYIGISANSLTYPKAIEIASSLKAINRHIPIILGGIHASLLPNQILTNQQCFDYLIKGQGEVALFKLLSGESVSNIPNLIYKDTHGIIKFNKSNFIPIENFSIPDFSLIDTSIYSRNFVNRYSNKSNHNGIAFISSTGCQWKSKTGGCCFCSIPNGPLSRLSPSQFWNTVRFIKNTTEADFFWDVSDTFTSSNEWIASTASSKPYNDDSRFHIYGRANDLIQDGVINNLKRIGVEEILIGAESFDDSILKKCNKGVTVSQIFKALKRLDAANIKIAISLILGLPGENEKSINNTIESCKRIKDEFTLVNECHASIITPLPGSALFTDLLKIPSMNRNYSSFDLIPLDIITKDYICFFTECIKEQIDEAYLTIDNMFPSAGPFYMNKDDPIYNRIGYVGSI